MKAIVGWTRRKRPTRVASGIAYWKGGVTKRVIRYLILVTVVPGGVMAGVLALTLFDSTTMRGGLKCKSNVG
jgi:hypothetical protein